MTAHYTILSVAQWKNTGKPRSQGRGETLGTGMKDRIVERKVIGFILGFILIIDCVLY